MIATCSLSLAWKFDVNDASVRSADQWQLAIYTFSKGKMNSTPKDIFDTETAVWKDVGYVLGPNSLYDVH
jgi:hypothetical protein